MYIPLRSRASSIDIINGSISERSNKVVLTKGSTMELELAKMKSLSTDRGERNLSYKPLRVDKKY